MIKISTLFISVFTPLVIDIINVPIASELDEISAIAESPCILLFSFSFNIRKDASMTIGSANSNGAKCNTVAIANAPNPTCDSPSPIIEFLFKTIVIPIKDEQIDISIPTIKALTIKLYENISTILFTVHTPYEIVNRSKEYFIFSK